MKKFLTMSVSKQELKKIKKGKQTVMIRLNNEENKKIKSKDRIIIQGSIGSFRKKVKGTRVYSTLEELTNNIEKKQLGYKKKDIPNYNHLIKDYSDEDIKKYGFLVIELRKKKHIFRKILLGILIVVLSFVGYRYISNKIDELNIKKFRSIVEEVSKERIDYVFIEINPSFVLTIKDDKVNDVSCLNTDCLSIYNDIDIKGKNINESIDSLYNISKEKGFDTSNGVKVKTSDSVNIESKDYITIEHIDTAKEKELLNEVKNNENIKSVNNDYYSQLWEELKKDEDYNVYYNCNMNNNMLECYIKDDIELNLSNLQSYIDGSVPKLRGIARVLNKFEIETELLMELGVLERPIYFIYIDGEKFVEAAGQTIAELEYLGNYDCADHWFKLTDLNLLNPESIKDKFYNKEWDMKPQTGFENSVLIDKCSNTTGYCANYKEIYVSACNENTSNYEWTGEVIEEYYLTKDGEYIKQLTKDEYDNFNIFYDNNY